MEMVCTLDAGRGNFDIKMGEKYEEKKRPVVDLLRLNDRSVPSRSKRVWSVDQEVEGRMIVCVATDTSKRAPCSLLVGTRSAV